MVVKFIRFGVEGKDFGIKDEPFIKHVSIDPKDPYSYFRAIDKEIRSAGTSNGTKDLVVILEHDIAPERLQINRMAQLVFAYPDAIQVAPYKINKERNWVHRKIDDHIELFPLKTRYVTDEDSSADLYGFGMTYIPRDLWCWVNNSFDYDKHWFTLDTRFSWQTFKTGHRAWVLWHLHEVKHLHDYQKPYEEVLPTEFPDDDQ